MFFGKAEEEEEYTRVRDLVDACPELIRLLVWQYHLHCCYRFLAI